MEAMSQHEYLVIFISIILGLGLTELLQNLRGLVQSNRTVQWHALPLLWAGLVVLVVMQLWWAFYEVTSQEVWQNYFAFLPLLLFVMGTYLYCAFALPNEDEGDIDLEAFYFSRPRRAWFFGSLIGTDLIAQGTTVALQGQMSIPATGLRWGAIGLFAGMIFTDRKSYHWSVTVFGLAVLMYFVLRFQLQLGG